MELPHVALPLRRQAAKGSFVFRQDVDTNAVEVCTPVVGTREVCELSPRQSLGRSELLVGLALRKLPKWHDRMTMGSGWG